MGKPIIYQKAEINRAENRNSGCREVIYDYYGHVSMSYYELSPLKTLPNYKTIY